MRFSLEHIATQTSSYGSFDNGAIYIKIQLQTLVIVK